MVRDGDTDVRCRLRAAGPPAIARRLPTLSLVSPTAHVSPSVVLGQNALVFPGVFLGAEVRIGDMFCAHGGGVVEHHGQLGHNVLLKTGGCSCRLREGRPPQFPGRRCVLNPERKVATGSLLGAGSVVVKDIPPHVVAYGHPAHAVPPVRSGDDVPMPMDIAGAAMGFA